MNTKKVKKILGWTLFATPFITISLAKYFVFGSFHIGTVLLVCAGAILWLLWLLAIIFLLKDDE